MFATMAQSSQQLDNGNPQVCKSTLNAQSCNLGRHCPGNENKLQQHRTKTRFQFSPLDASKGAVLIPLCIVGFEWMQKNGLDCRPAPELLTKIPAAVGASAPATAPVPSSEAVGASVPVQSSQAVGATTPVQSSRALGASAPHPDGTYSILIPTDENAARRALMAIIRRMDEMGKNGKTGKKSTKDEKGKKKSTKDEKGKDTKGDKGKNGKTGKKR
jgi:hypothetical protein